MTINLNRRNITEVDPIMTNHNLTELVDTGSHNDFYRPQSYKAYEITDLIMTNISHNRTKLRQLAEAVNVIPITIRRINIRTVEWGKYELEIRIIFLCLNVKPNNKSQARYYFN